MRHAKAATLLGVLAVLALSSGANAALIAEETFTGYDNLATPTNGASGSPKSIPGTNGGIGWADTTWYAWNGQQQNDTKVCVRDADAEFCIGTTPTPTNLGVAGIEDDYLLSFRTGARRSLAEEVGGAETVTWISFGLRVSKYQQRLGLQLLSGGLLGTPVMSFSRLAHGASPEYWDITVDANLSVSAAVIPEDPDNTTIDALGSEAAIYVLKIVDDGVTATVSAARYYDTLAGQPEPTEDTAFAGNIVTLPSFVFDTIVLQNPYKYDSNEKNNYAYWDNIRIGTTFVDVIPEPATMGLLALGALGVLGRRRK